MPPPRTINIGPYSFSVTAAYTNGARAVGPPEREVLDTARAKRVRKKGFKVFEKLRQRSGRRTLSEGELRHLTTTLLEFDRDTTLEKLPDPRGVQSERPSRLATEVAPGGPPDLAGGEFDAEVTRLCDLRIATEEASRGIILTPTQREAAIAALWEDPLIREAARARVDATLAEREKMLGDLF